MGGYFISRPLIGVKMIYYKNKEGKIIGKKTPSDEQIKIYKKEGLVECDENGNSKSKASKTKKK